MAACMVSRWGELNRGSSGDERRNHVSIYSLSTLEPSFVRGIDEHVLQSHTVNYLHGA
jgi:hypothetical protein